MIEHLCREIIAYAEERPMDVRAQRLAEMARQVLADEMIPLLEMKDLKSPSLGQQIGDLQRIYDRKKRPQ